MNAGSVSQKPSTTSLIWSSLQPEFWKPATISRASLAKAPWATRIAPFGKFCISQVKNESIPSSHDTTSSRGWPFRYKVPHLCQKWNKWKSVQFIGANEQEQITNFRKLKKLKNLTLSPVIFNNGFSNKVFTLYPTVSGTKISGNWKSIIQKTCKHTERNISKYRF